MSKMENQACPRTYQCGGDIDFMDYCSTPEHSECPRLHRPNVQTNAKLQRLRTCCSDSLEFELLGLIPIGGPN